MAGYQSITIMGNVGRDPETKTLQSGKTVTNFSVAVSSTTGQGDNRTEKTTWFRVAAWDKLGELCAKYLDKGSQVLVIGTIDVRAYDKDGTPQASLELTARDVRFLSNRESAETDSGTYSAADLSQVPF